jgi:hypothetical protein
MLTALVLICSLATTPDLASCTRDNAVDVLRVPELFGNPTMCIMHGQAYLADTSLGRDLADNERVKVICVRATATAPMPTRIGAAQTSRPAP